MPNQRDAEDNPEFEKYWKPLKETGCSFEGYDATVIAMMFLRKQISLELTVCCKLAKIMEFGRLRKGIVVINLRVYQADIQTRSCFVDAVLRTVYALGSEKFCSEHRCLPDTLSHG